MSTRPMPTNWTIDTITADGVVDLQKRLLNQRIADDIRHMSEDFYKTIASDVGHNRQHAIISLDNCLYESVDIFREKLTKNGFKCEKESSYLCVSWGHIT